MYTSEDMKIVDQNVNVNVNERIKSVLTRQSVRNQENVKLDEVPNLIVVVISALVQLNSCSTRCSDSVSKVETFAPVGPGDTPIVR